MTVAQNLFAVFFAIFSGFVGSVQLRWNMFPWAEVDLCDFWVILSKLLCRRRRRAGAFSARCNYRAAYRLLLSTVLLNLIPLAYFIIVFFVLRKASNSTEDWDLFTAAFQTTWGILPSFAAFGFYRLWIGIVQCCPRSFYNLRDRRKLKLVRVERYRTPNIVFGVLYVLIPLLVAILMA